MSSIQHKSGVYVPVVHEHWTHFNIYICRRFIITHVHVIQTPFLLNILETFQGLNRCVQIPELTMTHEASKTDTTYLYVHQIPHSQSWSFAVVSLPVIQKLHVT